MALQKITNKEIEEKQVASLPDRMTGTAAENKAAFDALTKALIAKYNELIDTLMGQGGAAAIGSEPFAGVDDAATVRDQLMKLQENIANAVSGSIPDASITEAKLADDAVSAAKIADGAVTAAKIADGEIVNAKIRDLTIETSKLANGAVTDAKLANGAVTARTMTEDAIALAQAGLPKAQTGSYTGTDTAGPSNPTIITFNFAPKLVMIFPSIGETYGYVHLFAITSLTSSYREYGYFYGKSGILTGKKMFAKFDNNTLSFYDNSSTNGGVASAQANSKYAGTYYWIAIG